MIDPDSPSIRSWSDFRHWIHNNSAMASWLRQNPHAPLPTKQAICATGIVMRHQQFCVVLLHKYRTVTDSRSQLPGLLDVCHSRPGWTLYPARYLSGSKRAMRRNPAVSTTSRDLTLLCLLAVIFQRLLLLIILLSVGLPVETKSDRRRQHKHVFEHSGCFTASRNRGQFRKSRDDTSANWYCASDHRNFLYDYDYALAALYQDFHKSNVRDR